MPSPQHHSLPRASRTLGTFTALGAGVLLLSACAGPAASGTSDADGGPRIVATTTQVGDFVHELVGDTAEVTQLLSPGQSAHSFDPSAAQMLALADADAVVMNGAGLESWLDDALDASGFDGELIDASTGVELFGTDDHDHDHDHDQDGDAEHSDDEHADEGHEGHDHGDGNPHIWTDPELAVAMVENIATGLQGVAGIDAARLEANESAYVGQLEALDDWIEQSVDQVPEAERLLVTNHDAFTYYIDAYHLVFVGSVIPSFDDNAEPSADEIDRLVADIEATGAKAVFSEASISPKAAEAIGSEAGVAVYSGPDALYGDSLGAAGTEGETYVGSQIHNTRLIVESWGAEPSALPGALQ
ncbi:zinc/manganese transport system substrate-binding protein/manganese/iron transport system substrate-binding protein [Agromyces terreus]|uniref:Zinc/manganese transport system substrate-binding protein/manganese/iron transport system substrate-binding protein n=1 Tax=Agromyces terreus TaxID=424795 RepID=A0A9X2H405_9MICO|nr:metal ABC transporter substrate-binding protein [Agromyces terreus]MCP2370397.1 zinc/manganese transport system substrate-binding protein/manganese/iron transport system substrate-binding protein [Agromyces terreus]